MVTHHSANECRHFDHLESGRQDYSEAGIPRSTINPIEISGVAKPILSDIWKRACGVVVCYTAHDPAGPAAASPTLRIGEVAGSQPASAVRAPFPNIAHHIEQSPLVRDFGPHGRSPSGLIGALSGVGLQEHV